MWPSTSVGGAVGTITAQSLLFVGSLYLLPREVTRLPRDHPRHIQWRMGAVATVSAISWIAVPFWKNDLEGGPSVWEWLGLRSNHLVEAMVASVGLTLIAYTGPLLQKVLDWRKDRQWRKLHGIPSSSWKWKDAATDLVAWRTFVVGPVAEEWVFRACAIAPLIGAGFGTWGILAGCTLPFGLAHAHHVFEHAREMPWWQAWALVGVQLVYTSLFGGYSAFMFLRTGHFPVVVASHMLCNVMGLPDFEGALQHRHKGKVIAAYVFGLIGFVVAFPRLLGDHFESIFQ